MGYEGDHRWHEAAASALEWWRDAGVDALVSEDPRDWFAAPEPPKKPAAAGTPAPYAPPPPPPKPVLPGTLEAFLEWRLSDDAPEAKWSSERYGAEGNPGADIMLVIDMPEQGTEQLIGGPAGQLLDRMLAAIGLNRESVYIAPVCVARPLSGRIPSEAEEWLSEIIRQWIALAAPKRILLLGQSASRAVVAMDGMAARGSLHEVNHQQGKSEAVASLHPRLLLERPAFKSEAWKDLQLLIGGIRQ